MAAFEGNLARKHEELEIVLERRFDASPGRVFGAFTEPEMLKRWWGPNGFSTPFCKVDLRTGGAFHYCMRGPDGKEYWGKGVYRQIVPGSFLEWTDTFSDAKGNFVPPTDYDLSVEWPPETTVSVSFDPSGTGTRLRLRHEVPGAPEEEFDQCRQGWTELIDRLDALLKR